MKDTQPVYLDVRNQPLILGLREPETYATGTVTPGIWSGLTHTGQLVEPSGSSIGQMRVVVVYIRSIPASPSALKEASQTSDPILAAVLSKETQWHQILQWYKVADQGKVGNFIRRQSQDLFEILIDAIPYLERHFGRSPKVELVIEDDPEENSHELFAEIVTTLEPAEALRRLHQFDSEWFLGNLGKVAGIMNFNLAFE